MVTILVITTTVLMFLAFGSIVLPIKAALMSALTLGSTMGILTWMFVDGHGSGLLNYTPQPLMAPMIGLIIAVIWGLSTDYEVFLVSRMVEARERGMSTAEAIRIGTATTGRLITGAALVLAVVAGAFAFSDLVMMKYLAFGLLIALLLDATVIRMFLVPAIMKLLGDDCWWAPHVDETNPGDSSASARPNCPTSASARWGRSPRGPTRPGRCRRACRHRAPHDPTHPAAEPRRPLMPRTNAPSAAGTARITPPQPPAQQHPSAQQEPATTRFAAARNAVRNAVNTAVNTVNTATGNTSAGTERTPQPPARPARGPAAPPQREDREIESWLGALRGGSGQGGPANGTPPPPPPRRAPAPRPSADATRAMPQPQQRPPAGGAVERADDRVQRTAPAPGGPGPNPRQRDQDPSTQKLNPRDDEASASRRRDERAGSAAPRRPALILRWRSGRPTTGHRHRA